MEEVRVLSTIEVTARLVGRTVAVVLLAYAVGSLVGAGAGVALGLLALVAVLAVFGHRSWSRADAAEATGSDADTP